MSFKGSIVSRKHRAQMFILATMVIAVYIVTMTVVLVNFKAEQIVIERETLREPYLDSKREIQHFLEQILAEYSKNGSSLDINTAIIRINKFLFSLDAINSVRGTSSVITMHSDNFTLSANQFPYENVSDGNIYTSLISGTFDLKLSTVSSSITIDETFFVLFSSRVEVQGNTIFVQQSRGGSYTFISTASIYILNGTSQVFPTPVLDHSGIYQFSNIENLDNFGVLNVTLPNGVYIVS